MGCLDTRAGKDCINRRKAREVKIRTQGVWKPEYSISREKQGALARVMTWPDASYLIITFTDTTVRFSIHVRFAICGTTTGHPRSAPTTLMVATCLERRVLGVRSEALEARSNEALSRLFARTTRLKGTSDSRTALCVRMRPYSKADTVVSDGAPGRIGCAAITT
jgi:hypothetical protein